MVSESYFLLRYPNNYFNFQEGELQRNWQEQQETKEVALANLTLHTQKIPKDDNPIRVGISFAEGSNTLLNLDIGEFTISQFMFFIFFPGEYKNLLGPLEATGARRKNQILNTLGKHISKLQKHAFLNWSQKEGFFNLNLLNGFLEMKYLTSNTLILTNSKALYSILKPESAEGQYNRHLNFPFPTEESFKFFSLGGNNNISSSIYEKAKDMFKDEPFWGFYPPKQKSLDTPSKCKSDTKEFETILKDASYDEPIFLLLINKTVDSPAEEGVLFKSDMNGHFNYLDINDPSNVMFTKTFFDKLNTFVTNSKLLGTYFGQLEIKNKEKILDPMQTIMPLVIGFKGEHQAPLANVDIYFSAVKQSAFLMYLTPFKNSVSNVKWVSSSFLKELYPESFENLSNDLIEIMPNVKPYPLNPHMNRFEQPFILTTSNFGSLNYLDLNNKETAYAGDTHGAKSVVAILNYSTSKGKEIGSYQSFNYYDS